eukprot:4675091-Amphidinium_carterae.1
MISVQTTTMSSTREPPKPRTMLAKQQPQSSTLKCGIAGLTLVVAFRSCVHRGPWKMLTLLVL